jgi:hypothetical protein
MSHPEADIVAYPLRSWPQLESNYRVLESGRMLKATNYEDDVRDSEAYNNLNRDVAERSKGARLPQSSSSLTLPIGGYDGEGKAAI